MSAREFEPRNPSRFAIRLEPLSFEFAPCSFAFAGVMNTSEEYHLPVLDALTVIGSRAAIGTGLPDLGNAHIPKADLTGANLTDPNLKDAHLTAADLRGAT
jgi:uncharacterized protein YjbI with pentapeptide repeats